MISHAHTVAFFKGIFWQSFIIQISSFNPTDEAILESKVSHCILKLISGKYFFEAKKAYTYEYTCPIHIAIYRPTFTFYISVSLLGIYDEC